jgi:PilZ domain
MRGYESSLEFQVESEDVAVVDRRASPRKVIQVRARVTVEGEALLDADTIDLSHLGVGITSKYPLNLGQECIIELGVGVPIASPPVLRAEVRYCARLKEGEFRIGLQFSFVSIEAAELIVAALS